MNRSLFIGLSLLFVGFVFLVMENTFYQYLDEEGVLHETFFMPLGVLGLTLGIVFLAYYGVVKLFAAAKNHGKHK